ncbi:type III pantothenate kinase [Tautonia plasticadhaerens]|uniref:Type III pantothenate kinase n=1 Tax=Tautonia plasticadhaerens TaxID=2527974 RepID=A0A518H9F5_9BACT|nr:type III pantothenate kinase [Tautonia plasticadhaerens]QDV37484.1 Type III pantothenate kinase [Tautonia plasticadhaerens]
MPPPALVIDIGNSRIKWGRLDEGGRLVGSMATTIGDQASWGMILDRLAMGGILEVSVASVNPPAAERLGETLRGRGIGPIRWYRSAADVPVRHGLEAPGRTGADRALAVLAAVSGKGHSGPGIVVQCGTAITVERIGPDGGWQGGAIGIGLSLASRALHAGTAQLPDFASLLSEIEPPAWGASTRPAMTAGIVWGAVGTIRELIARLSEGTDPPPWVVWTGGDASGLAPLVGGRLTEVEPDLVLIGLSIARTTPVTSR